MSNEKNKAALDRDQALLGELERREQLVETENHAGYRDVVRRTRIKDKIDALDKELHDLKESAAEEKEETS